MRRAGTTGLLLQQSAQFTVITRFLRPLRAIGDGDYRHELCSEYGLGEILSGQQDFTSREVCRSNVQSIQDWDAMLHRFWFPNFKYPVELAKAVSMFEVFAVKVHLHSVAMMRGMEHDFEPEKRAVPKSKGRL